MNAKCSSGSLPPKAKEVQYRMRMAQAEGVPMTNYGVAIAQMKGILKRSLALFPDIAKLVD